MLKLLRLDLRWSELVKRHEQGYQPEDGVDSLDRKFLSREQKREERDMTRHCKRSESSEMSTIFECDQAERDNYQQNCFLVNMPAEQEGCISAECQGAYKGVPGWSEEEFDKCRLH